MTRRRFYYDKEMDAVLEYGANFFQETPQGPSVISDDVGAGVNGLRHMASGMMLDSKSRHRAENRARGLREVGNEQNFATPEKQAPLGYYERQVNDTLQQIQGNYNGTADRLRGESERTRR